MRYKRPSGSCKFFMEKLSPKPGNFEIPHLHEKKANKGNIFLKVSASIVEAGHILILDNYGGKRVHYSVPKMLFLV